PVSSFIPFWASIFMLITCLFVLLGMDKQVDDEEHHAAKKEQSDNHNVIASALWITVYVVMAYVVGMIPAAVAFTFFSMYFFGGKKLLMAVGTSVVLGLILFGLFEFILEKELYKGVFIEEYF
ncbi:MAG: tripartite tricarboxylate transporter TctB family protein, partial [Litorivicinaceae bacterium]|nr:tripartite tricarboxylate transporter TctB family protein [Litorivicinaceae bacterium]